jgi:hypothetical protein
MGMFDELDPTLTGEYDNYQKSGFTKAIESMPVYDKVALATSPIPLVGDVTGLFADAATLWNDPSWSNAGWAALGLLPFVPSLTQRKAWEKIVQNMPNERPHFYKEVKGLPITRTLAQGYDTVDAVIKGFGNAQLQNISPQARANWRAEGVSKKTQDVMEDVRKRMAKTTDPDEQAYLAKVAQGQLNQSVLFRNQYKNKSGDLLDTQQQLSYPSVGSSSPEEFSRLLAPYADIMQVSGRDLDTVFEAIRQQQRTGFLATLGKKATLGKVDLTKKFPIDENTPMLLKHESNRAAGMLNNTITRTPQFREIGKVLSSRPFIEPLQGTTELKDLAKSAKIDGDIIKKMGKTGAWGRLQKAFNANPAILNARTADEMVDLLNQQQKTFFKKSDGLTETRFREMLGAKQQGSLGKEELISKLEARGLNVYNKQKVLDDPLQPIIVLSSGKSDAFELGGVNVINTVYPNGKVVSFVNDQNDLMGAAAPKGGYALTVSAPHVHRFGGVSDDMEKAAKAADALSIKRNIDEIEALDKLGYSGKPKEYRAQQQALAARMFPPSQHSAYKQVAMADAIRQLQAPVMPKDQALAALSYLKDVGTRSASLFNRDNEDVQP